jgi:enterochelin esterase-like enzyme
MGRGYRRGVPMLAALLTAAFLPGFALTATGPDGGQVYSGTFPGADRPGCVYLPPGFASTPVPAARRYPVVYLLHGMPGSPSEYLDGTQLAEFADAGISSGSLRPFIAVAPAAGPDRNYNGEWAGRWERDLVQQIVPWVDTELPTMATRRGRVIAGLSAGGYGAADIGLQHADLFGAIESWSGYFRPLHDGPFKHASKRELAANDPEAMVTLEGRSLARAGMRFFLSSGPAHSHWFRPSETVAFAREVQRLGLEVTLRLYPSKQGEWRSQVDDGLRWAFGA